MYDIKINVWNKNIININEGNGFKLIELNVIEIKYACETLQWTRGWISIYIPL